MPTPVPAARSSVAWTALPDGAVLFSTESEVYYALNPVGALIWEQLRGGVPDLEALCTSVRETFPDAPDDHVRDDVVQLLDALTGAGLVDPPPAA